MKKFIVLLFVFLIAALFRVWNLGGVPHGFHSDEVVAGYEGTFLLKNHTDTYGNSLPIYFDKFGDFRPIGTFYLSGISNLLLGNSVFATRFAAAFFGALTSVVVYFLFLEVAGAEKKRGALFAAFVVSVLPWHVVLSRSTQESIIGILTISLGLVFLFRKKIWLSALLFFASYFLYTAHRILVPLVLASALLDFWVSGKKELFRKTLYLTVVFIILSALVLSTKWGRSRGVQILIFNDPNVYTVGQDLAHGDGPGNVLVARVFHNKAVILTRFAVSQYLSYFSPDFLFVHGGLPDRYHIPEQGLLYFSLTPFILFGFVEVLKRRKYLPLILFFVTPLLATFTMDDVPNMNRVSFMIVPIVIFAGFGLEKLLSTKVNKVLKYGFFGFVSLLLFLEIAYFSHEYFVHESQHKSFFRNDTYGQVGLYIAKNRSKYKKVYIVNTDDMPIYVWFFANNYDKNIRYPMNEKVDIFEWENMVFIRTDCLKDRISKFDLSDSLIVDGGDCQAMDGFTQQAAWVRGDSTKSFRALSNLK
ncbi:MAG TPA: hypothetical protein VLE91_02640 [Candidatus Saccharimonadales bacterium]|nr:hypothetical protein [Candidatus Saccharimonadales bacterium]